jgi:hypothetical protein
MSRSLCKQPWFVRVGALEQLQIAERRASELLPSSPSDVSWGVNFVSQAYSYLAMLKVRADIKCLPCSCVDNLASRQPARDKQPGDGDQETSSQESGPAATKCIPIWAKFLFRYFTYSYTLRHSLRASPCLGFLKHTAGARRLSGIHTA